MLDRVHSDLNAALKAGDKKTVDALRMLYSALKNAQIDAGGNLSDEQAITTIKKEMKRRVEARDLYANNGREAQAAQEEFERSLYSQYAPAELSSDQIDLIIDEVASSGVVLNFAGIMPEVMKRAKGSADGRLVSERVKAYLDGRND